MAFDLWRCILCHETNNDTADHRHHDYPEPEMVMPRTAEIGRETMKEEKVSKQTYQPLQQKRYASGNDPNPRGQNRNQQHSKLRGRRNHGRAGRQDRPPFTGSWAAGPLLSSALNAFWLSSLCTLVFLFSFLLRAGLLVFNCLLPHVSF